MNNVLKPKDPFHLTDEEIDGLCIFSGTYSEDAEESVRQEWRKTYRKVEEETNAQIESAGGVKNWYESGEGRSI